MIEGFPRAIEGFPRAIEGFPRAIEGFPRMIWGPRKIAEESALRRQNGGHLFLVTVAASRR